MSRRKQKQFLELFEPVRADLSRFCMAMTGSRFAGNDLVGETILAAYQSFDKLHNPSAFKSYLFTIATRTNNARKAKESRMEYSDSIDEFHLTTENRGDLDADVEQLYWALGKLPDNQKEAIILFEISGFKIAEIAEMQDSSVSAVKSQLKRGREKLTNILVEKKTLTNESDNVKAFSEKVSK